MNTKNVSFLPALALAVCAGLACVGTGPRARAAGGPAEAKASMNVGVPARPLQAEAAPFVFFGTRPALSSPPSRKPAKAAKAVEDKSLLLKTFLKAIVPAPITVSVKPNPLIEGSYVAVLGSDDALSAAAISDVLSKAQGATGRQVFVVSNIPVTQAVSAPPPPDPVTLTYTLRFLRGTLPSVAATGSDTSDITGIGTDTAASDLAGFLSKVYAPGDTTATAHENHLVLVGPRDHVNALRQMLALSLDIPSPQVRADIYTIQVNTTPRNRDQAQEKIEEIAAGIQIVRDFIHGSEGVLGAYLATDRAHVPADPADTAEVAALRKKLFDKMALAGYDRSPSRPLSLTDMLILLTVSDRGQLEKELTPLKAFDPNAAPLTLMGQLENSLHRVRRGLAGGSGPSASAAGSAPEPRAYARHSAQLVKLIDRIQAQISVARQADTPVPLFSRMARVYSKEDAAKASAMQGMCDFLDAWHDCQGAFLTGPQADPAHPEVDPREYPDRLSRQSAATDLLLKEAMDALTADLQAIYFQPLLDWIREDVRGSKAGSTGIDLVGTTSITVRDRTLGETQGTAESYFKYTPIPRLTLDSLTKAKDLAGGQDADPDTTTQHVATDANGVVLMANGDPLLLTPDKKLATDADGVALRKGNKPTGDPVVLTVPSAAQTKTPSALASTALGALTPLQSLALQAAFNEDASVPSYRKIAPGTSLAIRPFVLPDGGSARVQMSLSSTVSADPPAAGARDVPFDGITSHTVTTEATISAFDLETVSSFGVQTTAPGDYSWRVPLLDQIPLLGELFHGPRGRDTKRQDSIAIVNLTILPRSLDLVPYYVDAAAIKKSAKDRADAEKAVATRGVGQ